MERIYLMLGYVIQGMVIFAFISTFFTLDLNGVLRENSVPYIEWYIDYWWQKLFSE